MQDRYSIFIILFVVHSLSVSSFPIIDVNQTNSLNQLIRPGWLDRLQLCIMGNICNQSVDCCQSYQCGYAVGYDSNSNRCCGGSGATGCTVIPGTDGKGCCWEHFCSWIDETKKETICRRIVE